MKKKKKSVSSDLSCAIDIELTIAGHMISCCIRCRLTMKIPETTEIEELGILVHDMHEREVVTKYRQEELHRHT